MKAPPAGLKRLAEKGSVARSKVSSRLDGELQPLLEAGVIKEERARGGGKRLVVESPAVFGRFIQQKYPEGLEAAGQDEMSPSEGVRRRRDAKAGSLKSEALLLRATEAVPVTVSENPLPVRELTEAFGAACCVLEEGGGPVVDVPIAAVENWECFLRFEEMGVSAPLACFTAGRMSNRMLQWLSRTAQPGNPVIVCPDYDPVGLSEFMRVRRQCGEAARLHVPEEIDDLFSRYGKQALYRESAGVLDNLRGSLPPAAQRIANLIEETGAGVEQEVLA
jgi:hypothetical protein